MILGICLITTIGILWSIIVNDLLPLLFSVLFMMAFTTVFEISRKYQELELRKNLTPTYQELTVNTVDNVDFGRGNGLEHLKSRLISEIAR